jgi:hypothetical protein
MPIVVDAAEFERRLTELRRLCDEAGRPTVEVTAFMFALDERLLARCAELAVTRCVVAAPTTDVAALESFLDRYSQVAHRIGVPST